MDSQVKKAITDVIALFKGAKEVGLEHVPRKHLEKIICIEKEIEKLRKTPPKNAISLDSVDLLTLEEMVRKCTLCELSKGRKNTVFGEGSKHPILMLVGEAPGREEDIQGRPFVGRSGELLTKMLRAIGLERKEVFITSVIKCRPPRNRTPRKEEIEACLPYLFKQIELLDPRLILCLGATSARALLKTESPLSRLRGCFHDLDGRKLIVTYHPAYLLRFGGSKLMNLKKQAWHDLQMLQREYEKIKMEMEN